MVHRMDLKIKKSGFHIVNKIHNGADRMLKRRLTPKDLSSDDFFLVEFPKSGITWLSTIIGNAALIESGRPELVTFANVQFYVPDIHLSRHVGAKKFGRPPVRMIKSHSAFNPHYQFVIYLVRHPFSVMRSYHTFLQAHQKGYTLGFSALCKDKTHGIPAWRAHVNSWIGADKNSLRLHLIRYEDLVADGFTVIDELSTNFGWNLSRNSIETALSRSNMEAMKETEYRFRKHAPHYDFSFVGGHNLSPEELSDIKGWISEVSANELEALGYREMDL